MIVDAGTILALEVLDALSAEEKGYFEHTHVCRLAEEILARPGGLARAAGRVNPKARVDRSPPLRLVAGRREAVLASAAYLAGLHDGPDWHTAGSLWEDRDEMRRELRQELELLGSAIQSALVAKVLPGEEEP